MQQCDNHFHLVIPHPCEPKVLVLPSTPGWMLPHTRGTRPVLWADVGHVNRAARRLLGLDAATLRCLRVAPHPDSRRADFAYALDILDPSWRPPDGARWVAESDLDSLTWATPHQAAFLIAWFAEARREDPRPARPAWYRPGWYRGAAAWLEEQLGQAGIRRTGRIEQVRSCQRAAILRAPTAAGRVYLKAVPPLFAHEVPLTVALADRYPDHLPRLVAVEERRGWMLMCDAGRQDLADAWQSSLPEGSLGWYARAQIEESRRIARWLELGCADHRLERLADGIDPLLADTAALQPDDSPISLSPDEIGRLRALAPALKALCAELAASRIPYSIEHGDLWTQQILVQGGRFTFIDWSDSSISHPFFSLAYSFTEEEEVASQLSRCGAAATGAGALCARLRDAYLQPWTAFEPVGRLHYLLALARRLVGLHVALLYHRRILPGMENRWEMHRMLPHFLRRVLRSLEAPPADAGG